ncbi:tRNA-dihydrouridine synthase, partial [Anaerosporobacter sp.]|uniref:tRNA-dihydrouridine synthase n=1 Tax=Anaerosporobacter sp. TaxID=1872529 RepID=UPI00286F4E3A
ELDEFLEKIFTECEMKISVKTRIGKDSPEEFERLLEIYNKYKMEELIIHPRIQKDQYNNKPNLDVFETAVKYSKNPLCYNGDICNASDYEMITKRFPTIDRIMIGRGFIANPELVLEIMKEAKKDKKVWKAFHDEVYHGYQEIMSGDRNALFKMKEFWFYMNRMFTESEKYAKKIRKTQKASEYEEAVEALFREQDLL